MMTNLQLLLTICIPSLLVVLSWINNNSRFTAIEKRLDEHDRRFIAIDEHMTTRDQRFEVRFNDVIASNHRDALEIMRGMTDLHERVAVIETKQGV